MPDFLAIVPIVILPIGLILAIWGYAFAAAAALVIFYFVAYLFHLILWVGHNLALIWMVISTVYYLHYFLSKSDDRETLETFNTVTLIFAALFIVDFLVLWGFNFDYIARSEYVYNWWD